MDKPYKYKLRLSNVNYFELMAQSGIKIKKKKNMLTKLVVPFSCVGGVCPLFSKPIFLGKYVCDYPTTEMAFDKHQHGCEHALPYQHAWILSINSLSILQQSITPILDIQAI